MDYEKIQKVEKKAEKKAQEKAEKVFKKITLSFLAKQNPGD